MPSGASSSSGWPAGRAGAHARLWDLTQDQEGAGSPRGAADGGAPRRSDAAPPGEGAASGGDSGGRSTASAHSVTTFCTSKTYSKASAPVQRQSSEMTCAVRVGVPEGAVMRIDGQS